MLALLTADAAPSKFPSAPHIVDARDSNEPDEVSFDSRSTKAAMLVKADVLASWTRKITRQICKGIICKYSLSMCVVLCRALAHSFYLLTGNCGNLSTSFS